MATEIIKVPDIGDIEAAEVIEITVKVGDTVSEDDTLLVLESDKASMEVPSPKAGKVSHIKVNVGDKIGEGDEIVYLEIAGDSSSTAANSSAPAEKPAAAPATASATVTPVHVPDIGGSEGVEIIEINIKVGDSIAIDDPIVVLESDKASMEVPSPIEGEVVGLKVNVGDKVSEGDLLIEVRSSGSTSTETTTNTPAPSAGTSALETINVPDIGGAEDVEIIEVNVQVGQILKADDPIVVLESDKASMEVPCPQDGEVVSVLVKTGDKVSQGAALIELKTTSTSAPVPAQTTAAAPQASAPAAASSTIPSIQSDDAVKPSKTVHAGPAVRRLAREFGVDLALVRGSGPKARIVKEDVANWVKNKLKEPEKATSGAGIPAIPDQDFSKFGQVEILELNRIQQLTAQNMHRNWLNIPMVTQFDEADVTDLEAFRQSLKGEMEKRGVKISPLAFLVKACASALQEFPKFNVSLMSDGKRYVQKHYVNIGIAVDTPNGLIVPVIKDADKKSIWQLAEEIIDFAQRGRKGQVKPNEMQGGCFTISSLGGIGGTAFTPIVNAPEVAILGVSKNMVKPHWDGKQFVPRTFTPLSLSYDHKAVNGADAAKFTNYLGMVLGDIRRLVL
ncbi:dihydrolipoyllysine-residue acetyltransferase [Gynuella sunshinyii]|uniref:Acetyltransferase component of pyruvate dehydrogenase complex n=1 Tax=Gynuella sunshinyii YC6258 TaxID=1445510 RepID=A0A0C5VKX2_9GAMM|nr:dihydrolipoyllysine-residue acetyltransferase [Gynuella sunshinyii]AJQ94956.1 pyruvate/2-oxoglutarate dehydrogenase complex, dihydrolipoamide acyltransferase (E2) component,-related enzyme [Gynuella sunshinyii YC6258]